MSNRPTHHATPAHKPKKPFPVFAVTIAVVLILGVAAVLATSLAGDDSNARFDPDDFEVTVEGDALPPLQDGSPAADPAVGETAPELFGIDFDGEASVVTHDGTAKIVVFLAHWCHVCQEEVPVIQAWLDDGGLPDNVGLISVATNIDPAAPNYPPDEWLADEGWVPPVLVDDQAISAWSAYGGQAFPYFVGLDGDGKVLFRVTGALPPETLDQISAELAGSAT